MLDVSRRLSGLKDSTKSQLNERTPLSLLILEAFPKFEQNKGDQIV